MDSALKNVLTVASQYEADLNALDAARSPNTNPVVELLALKRIQTDLPALLATVNLHRKSKTHLALDAQIRRLAARVDDLLHCNHVASAAFSARFAPRQPAQSQQPEVLPSPLPPSPKDNYSELRKRLLADGALTLFDEPQASGAQLNDYHEGLQEELMDDLAGLASSLKSSAHTLSSKIASDAALVAETGENMARSLTLMQTVGSNLNSYLSEKSGGKITLFFMIKTMAFVFVLFFCMVVLTKILPKM